MEMERVPVLKIKVEMVRSSLRNKKAVIHSLVGTALALPNHIVFLVATSVTIPLTEKGNCNGEVIVLVMVMAMVILMAMVSKRTP